MDNIIFVTDREELEEMEIEMDLYDMGMSGEYAGWHWLYSEKEDLNVYYKFND